MKTAIIDYGAGNLFSVKNALERAGLTLLSVSADFGFTPPDDTTERWYIAAGKRRQLD